MKLRAQLFLYSLLITLPGLTFAGQKYAFVMGGAGDPPGPSTMFDDAFADMAKVLRRANYESTIVYDGGHPNTESMVEARFPKKRWDATPKNVSEAVDRFKKDIRAGRIKRGDQLLVVNLTHGRLKGSTESHSVVMNGGPFNMDELASLRDEAEKAGVKLAIVDQSCYSGNSLALATSKTCVLTLTGEEIVGYESEIEELWNNAKPGKNLEATFLDARERGRMAANPRISGGPGNKTDALLKAAQEHLVNYPLDIYRRLDATRECVDCFHPDPATFAKKMNLGKISMLATVSPRHVAQLKKAVEAHAAILKELVTAVEVERKFSGRHLSIQGKDWRWDQLVNFDLAVESRIYRELVMTEKDPAARNIYQNLVNSLGAVADTRMKLMRTNPDFAKLVEQRGLVSKYTKDLAKAADHVGILERKLYSDIYRNYREEGPNPCADFTL